MKKIVSILAVFVLCVAMVFPVTVSAASATASLTGPGTVRAGDTITLSFKLNGSGIYGVSGALSYDSNQVAFMGATQKIGGTWKADLSDRIFLVYDDELSAPINSNKTLFTVTFKVKDIPEGTKIKISYTAVTASDNFADINIGTVSYSATIAAPLSSDATLKSLTAGNATISPDFNPGITAYTAQVPFSVSKLDVKVVANDIKAKITVNSPNLVPGGTTKVTITVTAENGSAKTYTIAVKREQDPNYVASGNHDLSGITVEGFLLSPMFSPEISEYVIWLPYETEDVTVSATPADSRANVIVEGGFNLIAGADNEIKVICTAENGVQKVYTVIAKRAAAHSAEPDDSTEPTEPTDPTEPSEPADPTQPAAAEPSGSAPVFQESPRQQNAADKAMVMAMVAGVVCLAAGLGIGFFIGKKSGKSK